MTSDSRAVSTTSRLMTLSPLISSTRVIWGAVWGGDQQVSDVVLVHPLAGGVEVLVRSHGGRAGLHHLGSRGLLASADPVGSQQPDHGALPGDDHAAVPSLGACSLQRRPGGGAGSTGGHVTPDGVEDPAAGLPGPDGGEAGSDPVDLAEGVVVDGREPELREPARGSRAHVSKAVPAVHDHRPGPIENR